MHQTQTRFHKPLCLHGNLVYYQGFGILITGAPGSGKSWLSAYLINQGAELIADDMVMLYQQAGIWYGYLANSSYRGILHLRNSGFIAVPAGSSHSIPIHTHILLSASTKLKIVPLS